MTDGLRRGGERPLPVLLVAVGVLNILAGVMCCPTNGMSMVSPLMFGGIQKTLKQLEDDQLTMRQEQLDDIAEELAVLDAEAEEGSEAEVEAEAERAELEQQRTFVVSQPPVMRVSKMYEAYTEPRSAGWFIADGAASLLGNILLLISGIALLTRRPWGRKLALGVGVYKLLIGVASSLWYGFMVMPAMFENMTQFSAVPGGAPPPNLGPMMHLTGAIGAALLFLYSAIYPVALLVILNLKSIREVYVPRDNVDFCE